jgi:hypothetical protein
MLWGEISTPTGYQTPAWPVAKFFITQPSYYNTHNIYIRMPGPGITRYSDGLRAGQPEFNTWQGQDICLFSTASRSALRPTRPPIRWVPGVVSQGLTQLRRETERSPPYIAEVNNDGAIPPFPVSLHGVMFNYVFVEWRTLHTWSVNNDKVKLKSFLSLIKRSDIKTYWGSGGIAPRILDLGTGWNWVVSFTLLPLHIPGMHPPVPIG